MADPAPILFLYQIERSYRQGTNTLRILQRAELAVWPGQSVALVAPSGSGKSTLLHVAGLLEHQDAGEVYINEVPTSTLSDAERTEIRRNDIGFIYQAHHLLSEFSAVENVMLPQMVKGLAKNEARARATELLSYLGLKTGLRIAPLSCRAASSSVSRSRAPSPMRRASFSPTSRPATSIRTPPSTCSTRLPSSSMPRVLPRSSPPTTSILLPGWIVA